MKGLSGNHVTAANTVGTPFPIGEPSVSWQLLLTLWPPVTGQPPSLLPEFIKGGPPYFTWHGLARVSLKCLLLEADVFLVSSPVILGPQPHTSREEREGDLRTQEPGVLEFGAEVCRWPVSSPCP